MPGVGSIGFVESLHGEKVFVPLFRGATADLNTTLALAIMAVILTHIAGVMTTGAWGHLNRFININALLVIPKKIFKNREYTAILVQPINFFVGLIELVGELAKMASLSFRLFGNIFAGEVLISVMGAIAGLLRYGRVAGDHPHSLGARLHPQLRYGQRHRPRLDAVSRRRHRSTSS